MTHLELGAAGERIAVEFLKTKGFEILDTNYAWMKGEIDVIATTNNNLVFVEVKTRQTDKYGNPSMAVTRAKQRQIIKIANHFIQSKKLDLEARFDVISIVKNAYKQEIEHIENAFVPYA